MRFHSSLLCVMLTVFGGSSALAESKIDLKTIQVCQRLAKVMKPKGATPDQCYDQARSFLKQKNIKVMTGSYQAYFALSAEVKDQAVCHKFLKEVVKSTQELELDEARELFENDKAESLNQAYYSYQQCADQAKTQTKSEPKASSTSVK